jgi:hypothetical protein
MSSPRARYHGGASHLPDQSIFNTPAHLILHVDAKFDFEVPELLSMTRGHYWRVKSVTITLGWHDRHYEPNVSIARQRKAVCAILEYIRTCYLYVEIIISPFLELNDHNYCFPTSKPRDLPRTPSPIQGIVFRSSCDCGRGDTTER